MYDRIDVSQCEFCSLMGDFAICNCEDIRQRYAHYSNLCHENSNCYFKQLARVKQENKKLEKIINKSAERFCNDYLETFKENERLKSELQAKELELIMAKADLCRGCQYKNDYKAKEQECEELINQRDKFEFGNNILEHERNNYKQALDEIEH